MTKLSEIPLLAGFDDDQIVPSKRRFWPFADDALVTKLGLDAELRRMIVDEGLPRCDACGGQVLAHRLDTQIPVRHEGMYLAVLPPMEFGDYSEWSPLLEALGVQYVLSEQRVRVADAVDSYTGVSPIVVLENANEANEFLGKVRTWLARHRGELSIFYLASRNEVALPIVTLTEALVCGSCGLTVDKIRPEELTFESGKGCNRCAGIGWLAGPAATTGTCPECLGCGFPPRIARGTLRSWEIRMLPSLRLSLLVELAVQRLPSMRDLASTVVENFGAHAAGHRYHWLSSGERLRLHLVTLAATKTTNLSLRLWQTDLDDKHARTLVHTLSSAQNSFHSIDGLTPRAIDSTGSRRTTGREEQRGMIMLKNLSIGPFLNETLEFPIGKLSFISGGVGSGKTVLLRAVHRLYGLRKKLSQSVLFPKISSCVFVRGPGSPTSDQSIGDLTSMRVVLARIFASTRESRLAGLSEESYLGRSLDSQCSACTGTGLEVEHQVCSVCEGTGLSGRLRTITFGGESILTLLKMPLDKLGTLPWLPMGLRFVCELASRSGLSSQSLRDRTSSMDSVTRGVWEVFGELARTYRWEDRPGANRHKSGTSLILMDCVFGRLPIEARHAVVWGLGEVLSDGGTILCAERESIGELQSLSPYVIGLAAHELAQPDAGLNAPTRSRLMLEQIVRPAE